ncbi:MAG: hypothetical protein ACKO38_02255, partial [Planctomycetota bacterium]
MSSENNTDEQGQSEKPPAAPTKPWTRQSKAAKADAVVQSPVAAAVSGDPSDSLATSAAATS